MYFIISFFYIKYLTNSLFIFTLRRPPLPPPPHPFSLPPLGHRSAPIISALATPSSAAHPFHRLRPLILALAAALASSRARPHRLRRPLILRHRRRRRRPCRLRRGRRLLHLPSQASPQTHHPRSRRRRALDLPRRCRRRRRRRRRFKELDNFCIESEVLPNYH